MGTKHDCTTLVRLGGRSVPVQHYVPKLPLRN